MAFVAEGLEVGSGPGRKDTGRRCRRADAVDDAGRRRQAKCRIGTAPRLVEGAGQAGRCLPLERAADWAGPSFKD